MLEHQRRHVKCQTQAKYFLFKPIKLQKETYWVNFHRASAVTPELHVWGRLQVCFFASMIPTW